MVSDTGRSALGILFYNTPYLASALFDRTQRDQRDDTGISALRRYRDPVFDTGAVRCGAYYVFVHREDRPQAHDAEHLPNREEA